MVLPFLRQTAKRQCHGSVCVQPFLRFFIVSLPSIGLLRFPDRMPCSDAEKLALKAFLGQKRGMRKLISSTVEALHAYFAAKNTPVTELPTMRPPSTREQEQWGSGPADAHRLRDVGTVCPEGAAQGVRGAG